MIPLYPMNGTVHYATKGRASLPVTLDGTHDHLDGLNAVKAPRTAPAHRRSALVELSLAGTFLTAIASVLL